MFALAFPGIYCRILSVVVSLSCPPSIPKKLGSFFLPFCLQRRKKTTKHTSKLMHSEFCPEEARKLSKQFVTGFLPAPAQQRAGKQPGRVVMGLVLHLLVFLCFFTCLRITKQSAWIIPVSKSAEGPDVPLQTTKPKSSPDNCSRAPAVDMYTHTPTDIHKRIFISIFAVFLPFLPLPVRPPASPHTHTISQPLPTPLLTPFEQHWDCFAGTF